MRTISKARTKGNILLVERDPELRAFVSRTLGMEGYTVFESEDGYQAFLLSETLERPLHILLAEVVVGADLSGVELALHMREHFPECKVLLISGQASVRDFSTAFLARSSAVRFAAKPVEPEKILEFVASCGRPGASGSNGAAGESLPQA